MAYHLFSRPLLSLLLLISPWVGASKGPAAGLIVDLSPEGAPREVLEALAAALAKEIALDLRSSKATMGQAALGRHQEGLPLALAAFDRAKALASRLDRQAALAELARVEEILLARVVTDEAGPVLVEAYGLMLLLLPPEAVDRQGVMSRLGRLPAALRSKLALTGLEDQGQGERAGPLVVTSHPAGAQVFLDLHQMCVTPCTLDRVAAGRHHLALELSGRPKWAKGVDLAPDRPLEVLVEMGQGEEMAARVAGLRRRALAFEGKPHQRKALAEMGLLAGAEVVVAISLDDKGQEVAGWLLHVPSGQLAKLGKVSAREAQKAAQALARAAAPLLASAPSAGPSAPQAEVKESTPWYKRWWIWVGLATAVGFAVTYSVMSAQQSPDQTQSLP